MPILRGFSLIEMLVTLALMSVLAGVAFGGGIDAFRRSLFHTDCSTLASVLRHARAEAFHQVDATSTPLSYGVYLSRAQVTIYRGTTYTLRDTALDETLPLESIHAATTVDAVFSPGGTSTPAAFAIVPERGNFSCTVSINSEAGISGP
jgi:prepilin-type N-terminal cleavage/methylation domain-containing protein